MKLNVIFLATYFDTYLTKPLPKPKLKNIDNRLTIDIPSANKPSISAPSSRAKNILKRKPIKTLKIVPEK